MSKPKRIDINRILLKAHKQGIKEAIEKSARTNTFLVVYRDGKVKQIKPAFKYVRVEVSNKKQSSSKKGPLRKK